MLEISKPAKQLPPFGRKCTIISCKTNILSQFSLCCCSRPHRESRSQSQSLEAAPSPPCPLSSERWKVVRIWWKNISYKKYLKMTIRTTRGGRAWTREEPTQLELVQSHLENKIIWRADSEFMCWPESRCRVTSWRWGSRRRAACPPGACPPTRSTGPPAPPCRSCCRLQRSKFNIILIKRLLKIQGPTRLGLN